MLLILLVLLLLVLVLLLLMGSHHAYKQRIETDNVDYLCALHHH